MVAEIFKWLVDNPVAMAVTLALAAIVVLLFIIAFVQGREISIGSFKIGKRDSDSDADSLGMLSGASRIGVNRPTYINQVVAESLKPDNREILILASGLRSRDDQPDVMKLQDTWAGLRKIRIRLLVRQGDDNIRGACELMSRGVSVRLAESTGLEFCSFHIFKGDGPPRIILNRKNPKAPKQDAPILFKDLALARVMEKYFNDLWEASSDVSEYLTSKAYPAAQADGRGLESIIDDIETVTGAPSDVLNEIRFRVALFRTAKFVFIVGLPGAGKTSLRNRLRTYLSDHNIHAISWSDYPILYERFLKEQLSRCPEAGGSHQAFAPDLFGGFEVLDNRVFGEAIETLKEACLTELNSHSIVLVEFARSDCLDTLEKFGRLVGDRCQVIYVAATERDRLRRIKARSGVPLVTRQGEKIMVIAGENHYMSEDAVHRLYMDDDLPALQASPYWSKRFRILDTNAVSEVGMKDWVTGFYGDITRKAE